MATLHLQTDLLSSFHAHQHPSAASTAARSHPNEADYAAVTPTAARPHPEKGYTSLFDAFVPPQYAFEHARESYRAAQRPTSSSSGQEASTMGGHEGMAAFSSGADNMDMLHHHYQPAAHSSLSSSGSEVSTTGGPATPPSGPALSGRASPASSFASVPGNTIYSSTGIHYEQLQQFHPALQGYSQPNIGAAMVANTHPAGYQIQQQHCSQQDNAVYPYNAPIYGHLQYPSYTPAYNNEQYAIYTGINEATGPAPGVIHPASTQVSPVMAYNLLNNGMTVAASAVGNDQAVVPASFCAVPQAGAYSPTHYHHANQSSLSNTNLQGGSPEPSLSGSDDSGNTSKSTLLSGLVRSNPASRRGSVSSVVSNVGTPYAGNRKDGEKKFVCSYPGCKRAFSRNFNLSTHYNTHLGIKPFPCTHCPKSFSRRHDCARHIAAVHVNELKKGSLANNIQAENGSISPKSCGCGHTCPAHAQAVPPLSVSSDYTGVGSAFASIKGRHLDEEDDLFSGSASSSGYESTTSTQSIDSFIGANFEGLAMRNNDSRSPSIDPLSNPSLDLGLVKIEDGEGE